MFFLINPLTYFLRIESQCHFGHPPFIIIYHGYDTSIYRNISLREIMKLTSQFSVNILDMMVQTLQFLFLLLDQLLAIIQSWKVYLIVYS